MNGYAGLFRPRWSVRILDETQKANPQITKGANDGSKQCAVIEAAFPVSLVTGYEVFESNLDLPDTDDNHVLAAALSTSASVIVTDNLKDCPPEALTSHAIAAISVDEFIADTIDVTVPLISIWFVLWISATGKVRGFAQRNSTCSGTAALTHLAVP